LGCGTGQAALKLAPFVYHVVAIDPQPEMLREGKKKAESSHICNITWLKGESGRLPDMAAQIGQVNLTVIAWAFHWMDREQTLSDLYKLSAPDGGIAVIWDTGPAAGLWDTGQSGGRMFPWKEVIQRIVKKWLGNERKAGTEGTYSHPTRLFEDYLKESEFRNLESVDFQLERFWSTDEIIGYMYSSSMASSPVLGNKKEVYEADLRKQLLAIEPSGRFKEPATISVAMAWK
jgi:ubiquinone/menaquinone biosynthesis C-methylase UbiE